MIHLHPFPLFKWHHSWLRSWQARPSAPFCVCFQILCLQQLTLHTHSTQSHQLLLDSVPCTPEKVGKIRSTLDSDSETVSDGMSLRVRKTSALLLLHFLFVLFFSMLFARGHLPSAWKSAQITASSYIFTIGHWLWQQYKYILRSQGIKNQHISSKQFQMEHLTTIRAPHHH